MSRRRESFVVVPPRDSLKLLWLARRSLFCPKVALARVPLVVPIQVTFPAPGGGSPNAAVASIPRKRPSSNERTSAVPLPSDFSCFSECRCRPHPAWFRKSQDRAGRPPRGRMLLSSACRSISRSDGFELLALPSIFAIKTELPCMAFTSLVSALGKLLWLACRLLLVLECCCGTHYAQSGIRPLGLP